MLYAGGEEWGRMCHLSRALLKRLSVLLVSKFRQESGAELVEAAVVIPILLMLLLGIVTFGRAWNVYQTITRAAREGARQAVLTPCADSTYCSGATAYTSNDIWTKFVDPVLASDNLDSSKILNPTITYVPMDPNDPTPSVCGVQVSFEYPYTFSVPFTSINLSTVTLSTKAQMRLETQPSSCQTTGSSY